MAKKIDRGEPKKECPSCGLGVSLEANICEFCGWDFEEEDEWILQIEKLERDLLLEKQKFEPGTVSHRIESTLRSPLQEKVEAAQVAARTAEAEEPEQPTVVRASEFLIDRESPAPSLKRETPASEPARERTPAPAPGHARGVREVSEEEVRKAMSVRPQVAAPEPGPEPAPQMSRQQASSPPLRKVKQPEPKPQEPVQVEQQPTRKVRTVRKVKG